MLFYKEAASFEEIINLSKVQLHNIFNVLSFGNNQPIVYDMLTVNKEDRILTIEMLNQPLDGIQTIILDNYKHMLEEIYKQTL